MNVSLEMNAFISIGKSSSAQRSGDIDRLSLRSEKDLTGVVCFVHLLDYPFFY